MIARAVVNIAILAMLAGIGVILYWAGTNLLTPSTSFEEPRIIGPSRVHVGDTVRISYFVTRYRSCRMEISRLFRRPDNREILLQYVVQNIVADDPPYRRPTGYSAEMVVGMLNPGETEITGQIFSRVQYFCNGLDLIWPRLVQADLVTVTVEAR